MLLSRLKESGRDSTHRCCWGRTGVQPVTKNVEEHETYKRRGPLPEIHFHDDMTQYSLDVLWLQFNPNLILRCPLQASICMCEEGFTEVLSPTGQLNQCAPIPILEIPTAGDKKGDVKTSRAINPTLPTTILPGRTGRTWYLQPYGPGQTTWNVLDQIHQTKKRLLLFQKYEKYREDSVVAVKWKPFNLLTVMLRRTNPAVMFPSEAPIFLLSSRNYKNHHIQTLHVEEVKRAQMLLGYILGNVTKCLTV